MSIYDRQLQQLRKRYQLWVPWLTKTLQASVRVEKMAQPGEAFYVSVTWKDKDGAEQTHVKHYTHASLGVRVACVKDYARVLIKEVYEKRGVL
jgi:hypothetical protein